MTYSLHPAAEQDIADALDFYAEHAGLLVARRFLSEFERVAQPLADNRLWHTKHPKAPRISVAGVSVLRGVQEPGCRSPNHRCQTPAQKAWLQPTASKTAVKHHAIPT